MTAAAKYLLLLISFFTCCALHAQLITLSGTDYDITRRTPVEAVSVLSTSGRGTATDSMGRYALTINERDSVYFSYLNKPTPKYAVADITNPSSFDISILVKVHELPSILLKPRSYRFDSLQNRNDYAQIFNYKRPGIGIVSNPGLAAGLDFDAFINMFKFKKNRRMLSYQQHLLREEREGYISHRFNKGLVKRLTGLSSPQLDSFMIEIRPTYLMVQQWNDLELGQFIVEAFKYYKDGLKVSRWLFPEYKQEEELQ